MYTTVTGYTYGTEEVAKSPMSMEHLSLLKQTVLFTEEDEKYLHLAGEVLQDQIDAILDTWYSFVGSHSHRLCCMKQKNATCAMCVVYQPHVCGLSTHPPHIPSPQLNPPRHELLYPSELRAVPPITYSSDEIMWSYLALLTQLPLE